MSTRKPEPLQRYRAKRNFKATPEPEEGGAASPALPVFVVQKHWASRLHYDFRLELDGTLKSWAVPKGPSLDPALKRMAMHVEDHPIAYRHFEGMIPPKQYGAGKVIVWDKGTWSAVGDPQAGYDEGKLKFELHGHKLQGRWALVRMKGRSDRQDPWLLIKEQDPFARPELEFSVVDERPESVALSPDHADVPQALAPSLATLVTAVPKNADDWTFEIKLDGYRLLAHIQPSGIRLLTRNGHDWTQRLPGVCRHLNDLHLPTGWYDGEIVVMNDEGLPDFQALQGVFDSNRTDSILYYLFDLPFCDGIDLRGRPLLERRQRLETLLSKSQDGPIRFSTALAGDARDILAAACKMGLEGVIGKQSSSPYVSGRTSRWIKLKCGQRQEFVIGGYTDPQGSRQGFGSLLLGVYGPDGGLHYVGNVGSGFDDAQLPGILQQLQALRVAKRPFQAQTGMDAKAHWVRPEQVVEVSFSQWTRGGKIRHAVFRGLRTDKPAQTITREDSMPQQKPINSEQMDESLLQRIKISHPVRVVDRSSGSRKIDVLRYYALVAPLMMAHLKGRPVSLVRAPDGVKGAMFFQKHLDTQLKGMRQLPQALDPDHDPLIEVAAPLGLLSAAQLNVIEFHTWNAQKTLIAKPDRMIFDLDPGKGVAWPAIQEAALLLRAFLTELGLTGFLKTSGGKGLHVAVPIQRRHDWDTVKGFSRAIVVHMAQTLPDRFASKSGPRNRVGKIFIDYLRNGFGATTVSAWSVRARPGMGASVPVEWAELEALSGSAHWHIGNIHERLDVGNQPWDDYSQHARSLTAAMKVLGYRGS